MRCYDGAPDSALKRILAARQAARRAIERQGARPVYFPAEGRWAAFRGGVAVTGFHDELQGVAAELEARGNQFNQPESQTS